MAIKHEKRIGNVQGIAGTSSMQIHFHDRSRLDFEANSTNPNPRTQGGVSSNAHAFASDVKSFSAIPPKITFVFNDNSKTSYLTV